jgi:hypothetical protein
MAFLRYLLAPILKTMCLRLSRALRQIKRFTNVTTWKP